MKIHGLPPPMDAAPAPSALQAPVVRKAEAPVPRTRKARAPAKPKGRAPRRPEEDVPGDDYVKRVTALGPRERESYIAFVMRISATRAGREFILQQAERCKGDTGDLCIVLGIDRHNLKHHLRNLGLRLADVKAFRPQ